MDGFEEKKWFVYLGDHHEGPFSLKDIQGKMSQGQVSGTSYVWAEGMADWKLMSEVSAFGSVLKPESAKKDGFFESPVIQLAEEASEPALRDEPRVELRPTQVTMETDSVENPVKRGEVKEDSLELRVASQGGRAQRPSKLKKVVLFGIPLLLALAMVYSPDYLNRLMNSPAVRATYQTISDTVQPVLLRLTESIPPLALLISPIPTLEDVSPADYDELRTAAATSPKQGARLAVALSLGGDPSSPSFYVASNLPDGSIIDLHVEGLPDTLLNQLSFSSKISATITKRLGKSGFVRFPDGKPLPRGQYDVFAIEGESQPPATQSLLAGMQTAVGTVPASLPKGFKLLVQKNYFLGGPQDAIYAARLKEFHDKLREKAAAELAELKQFAAVFDAQLKESTDKFAALYSLRGSPRAKKLWTEQSQKFNNLSKQMNEAFLKWTPEALQNEFFYGPLYEMLVQHYRAIEQVHQLQDAYFVDRPDRAAFEIQLGQKIAVARTTGASFSAKIEQAEKIPPSPNGMPRREGL